MKLISVIMAVHQKVAPLREAVAAVLNQREVALELLLVDNGAGLSAADLGVDAADPRLRWVRFSENQGIPIAHNAAVAQARGEWVALADYDDRCHPFRLTQQAAALAADPRVDLVSGRTECMDEFGRPLGHPLFMLTEPEHQKRYSGVAAAVVTPASMIRRSILAALPYREAFAVAADLDFQAQFFEKHRATVLPETVLDYRCYQKQTTERRRAEIWASQAVIQLLSARRRAADPEGFEAAIGLLDPNDSGQTRRRVAEVAAQENRWSLVALQARRLMAESRRPGDWVQALRLGYRAIRHSPQEERGVNSRLFWRGPVKAWGLKPMT